MHLTTLTDGGVRIAYHDPLQARVVIREFFCPLGGGYVQEWSPYLRNWAQVCEGLDTAGVTLDAQSREALPSLIRREYRRMRRANARRGLA
jgi:hypothetical protein